VAAIRASDTDLQKRKKWLDAVEEFEGVLSKNKATLLYKIGDVSFDQHADAATITGSNSGGTIPAATIKAQNAVIESGDPNIPDVKFDQTFFPIYLATSEAEAVKITTDSKMIITGIVSTGFDPKKPAAEQPAFLRQAGSLMIGAPNADRPEFRVNIWYQMRATPTIEIDGVKRKLYTSKRTDLDNQ
jgi:hypothetical protein